VFVILENVFLLEKHDRDGQERKKTVPSQKSLFTLMHDLLAPPYRWLAISREKYITSSRAQWN